MLMLIPATGRKTDTSELLSDAGSSGLKLLLHPKRLIAYFLPPNHKNVILGGAHVPLGAGTGKDIGEAAVRNKQFLEELSLFRRAPITLDAPVDRQDAEEDQGDIEDRPLGESEVTQKGNSQGEER